MLRAITHVAHRLDLWLQAKLGRPYNALLGVGLAIEIVRHVGEMPRTLGEAHRLAGVALLLALNLALLIHQVGALSHHVPKPRRPSPSAEAGEGEHPV